MNTTPAARIPHGDTGEHAPEVTIAPSTLSAAKPRPIQVGDLIDGQYLADTYGTIKVLRAIVTHVGEWQGVPTISAVGLDDAGQVSYLSQTTMPAQVIDVPGGDAHAAFLTRLRPLITSTRTAARLDALFFDGPAQPEPSAPAPLIADAQRTAEKIAAEILEVLPIGSPTQMREALTEAARRGIQSTNPAA